jgi:alkyl sulfatase BDS1-like metallo-beta-lactamase superfamily hydrolase
MATNNSDQYPDPSQTDFDNADKGFIQALDPCKIYSAAPGNGKDLVWDNDAYSFITGDCPDTANSSLWRQSQLCYKQGLYEVVENGVYQIRKSTLLIVLFFWVGLGI